jgi:hypothetical protein
MSHPSGIHAHGSARTIARFRSRPVQKPLVKASLDFLIARVGMTPSEILAHQREPGFEQVKRCSERVGHGRTGGWHAEITAAHGGLCGYCTAFLGVRQLPHHRLFTPVTRVRIALGAYPFVDVFLRACMSVRVHAFTAV